jgi:MoaA/NifB/PqqE/SkfB family radical SAM enzyme
MKSTIDRRKVLDLHITHNCNLTCESCSDFTNHGLSWMISLGEAEEWMNSWSKRIHPFYFNILGGEPTLHKNLIDLLYLSRKMWGEDQKINLVTNAFFLHQHKNLNEVLKETNIQVVVSLHSNRKEYINKIKDNILLIKKWKRNDGIKVSFTAMNFKDWRIVYRGYGENIMPFEDNNPQSSWENCFSSDYKCFQLYENKLWKCPPITYLPLMSKKYTISEKWNSYLNYKPLSPECSDKELEMFWNSECMDICSMCPSKKVSFETRKNPLMSVNETEKFYSSLE